MKTRAASPTLLTLLTLTLTLTLSFSLTRGGLLLPSDEVAMQKICQAFVSIPSWNCSDPSNACTWNGVACSTVTLINATLYDAVVRMYNSSFMKLLMFPDFVYQCGRSLCE